MKISLRILVGCVAALLAAMPAKAGETVKADTLITDTTRNEQLEQYCLRLVDGVITALVTVFGLTDEKEKLVSKREAMQQFGVCETTLYLWGKKGYLKPVKVGNRVMYRTDDINRIIGSNI